MSDPKLSEARISEMIQKWGNAAMGGMPAPVYYDGGDSLTGSIVARYVATLERRLGVLGSALAERLPPL